MTARLAMTQEDIDIAARGVRRVLRGLLERQKAEGHRASPALACRCLRNQVNDLMHFPPELSR